MFEIKSFYSPGPDIELAIQNGFKIKTTYVSFKLNGFI